MNRKTTLTFVILATSVGLCLAAPPASANPANYDSFSQTVRFKDLDLNDPDDAQTLLRRIRRAATMVCTGSPTRVWLTGQSRHAIQCMRQAQDQAVAKLDHPVVTAMYQHAPSAVQVATSK